MTSPLPPARTSEEEFLAGICQRLDAQNELLQTIVDRLPVPTSMNIVVDGGPSTVKLREPLVEPTADIETTSPSGPAGDTPAPKAVPARRAAAKKAAPAAKKGSSDA